MDLIERGVAENLIKINDELKSVTYVPINKKYRYTNPEEQVRVETYLQLIYNYGYEPDRIDIEVVVPRRTPSDLADIVVFRDEKQKEPWIIVECKRQEISDAEFTQAIEQGFGNANSLGSYYLMVTSGLKTHCYDVKNYKPMERQENLIADIPKYGQTIISAAKYTKGGVNGFELREVSESELTRIFKQAHDALWAGGKRNPAEAFDELDKLVFCKLWDERTSRKPGTPYEFQVFSGEKPEKLLDRLKKLYEKGRDKDPEVFKDDIRLSPKEVEKIVGYLAPVNLGDTDLDSKGRAFETFMGDFFRGEFGQYFTPRRIVKFIVDSLPIDHEALVLDPACGSGGFLLHALDKVRNIAAQKAEEGYFKKGSHEHRDYWHAFAEHNLYGIEISENIARTAKMNMIIHDDGHTNVISHDGLDSTDKIRSISKNQGFKSNLFDYIITNPPFGASVKYAEHRYIEDYELGRKDVDWIDAKLRNVDIKTPRDRQSSEILFLEKCHQFLKPGGIMAMVIPDGILTNSTSQYVRDWLMDKFRIVAVVSLPQTAFMATGAGVKSSVVFLMKYSDATTQVIRSKKQKIQTDIFEQDDYGPAILSLEEEKAKALKRGDDVIQEIQEELVRHLESLEEQGNLTSQVKKPLEKDAKENIKEHQKTEAYLLWKQQIADNYNERLNNIKESLIETYQEQIAKQFEDYPIFMAIAEDIGYDATGRETGSNELETISKELLRFIESVQSE